MYIYIYIYVYIPPKKILGADFSTPPEHTFCPNTPFCLICTIKSELTYFSDLYHL